MELVYSADYVDLLYDRDIQIVVTVWKPVAFSSEKYRDIYKIEEFLDQIKQGTLK